MKTKEYKFYDKLKNWDFSEIKYEEESLTNWDMYDILRKSSNSQSKILDLGTGGGEKVLAKVPEVSEILATDFSKEMIKTANYNLSKSNKRNITFRKMDNLNMDTPNNYFDIVVARHTCIDAKQIYNTLKQKGGLILRGVDKLDCWELKRLYGKGQAYNDITPISLIDYENILDAGFKKVFAHHHEENSASGKALLKAGFSYVDKSYRSYEKENINGNYLRYVIKNLN